MGVGHFHERHQVRNDRDRSGGRFRGAADRRPDRALRSAFGAWPGRLRHHLPGARRPARPRSRHQGVSADRAGGAPERHHRDAAFDQGGRGFLLGAGSLRRRGARHGDPASRAGHRPRLRLPRNQRHRLYRHGDAPRRYARRAYQEERPAGSTGDRPHPVAAARRSRAGPQCRLSPSRHQAGQHPARCDRQSNPDRFRRLARGDGRTHRCDDGDIHTGICGGRAIHLRQAGALDRYLRRGGHALPRHYGRLATFGLRAHARRCLRTRHDAGTVGLCARTADRYRRRPGGARHRSPSVDCGLAAYPVADDDSRRGGDSCRGAVAFRHFGGQRGNRSAACRVATVFACRPFTGCRRTRGWRRRRPVGGSEEARGALRRCRGRRPPRGRRRWLFHARLEACATDGYRPPGRGHPGSEGRGSRACVGGAAYR